MNKRTFTAIINRMRRACSGKLVSGTTESGRYIVGNAYMGFMFTAAPDCRPDDERTESVATFEKRCFADSAAGAIGANPLELPDLEALHAFNKAKGKQHANIYNFGQGLPAVAGGKLEDVMRMLPGCKIYADYSKPEIRALYAVDDEGNAAVLMPIQKAPNRRKDPATDLAEYAAPVECYELEPIPAGIHADEITAEDAQPEETTAAAEPAQETPAEDPEIIEAARALTRIKFYYNGIRINGERELIKCGYGCGYPEPGEPITIYADGYGLDIPRDLFTVQNETDYYTDYFDTDRAEITADHPLYKYVFAAKVAAAIHDVKHRIKHNEAMSSRRTGSMKKIYDSEAQEAREKLTHLEALTVCKDSPTDADYIAIAKMQCAAENARQEAERQAEIERREKYTAERVNGLHIIAKEMEAHPHKDGAPVVCIEWSEHPAFEQENIKMSVAAADRILAALDDARHKRNADENGGGYYKTKFRITWTDSEGEHEYEGRYDLGDNDGGLIAHIRLFAEYTAKTSPDDGAKITEFAEMLETHAEREEITITMAPEFWQWRAAKAQAAEAAERAKKDEIAKGWEEIEILIEMLTDDQIEDLIFQNPKTDPDKCDIARFFIQALARRDATRARDVLRRWLAA